MKEIFIILILLCSCKTINSKSFLAGDKNDDYKERSVFRIQDMKSMIETKKIKTIETLLEELPRGYHRRGASFVSETRSIQDASRDLPRMIISMNSQSAILAVGEGTLDGGDFVEAIEFDNNEYLFKKIEFYKDGSEPSFSEDNPQECQGCHSDPLRPNWDPYDSWAGVDSEEFILYFRQEDPAVKKELALKNEFIQKNIDHPRYKHFLNYSTFRHNTALNVILMDHFYQRLAKILLENENFKRHKPLVVAMIMECDLHNFRDGQIIKLLKAYGYDHKYPKPIKGSFFEGTHKGADVMEKKLEILDSVLHLGLNVDYHNMVPVYDRESIIKESDIGITATFEKGIGFGRRPNFGFLSDPFGRFTANFAENYLLINDPKYSWLNEFTEKITNNYLGAYSGGINRLFVKDGKRELVCKKLHQMDDAF